MPSDLTSQVHHGFILPLLQSGGGPSSSEVASRLGLSLASVQEALRSLEASHGVILHPHACEPWIMHPFSLSPSATWVEGANQGWWAPCMWCAFGIASLAKEPLTIHTRLGGENEDLDIHVDNGQVREADLWVHFAVPPRAAWDNVHHFCATVLPFRSVDQVQMWSKRHGIAMGSVIPIQQCADLGQAWYHTYAAEDWRKWSVRQAGDIFRSVGLVDPFWALPEADGGF